MIIYAALVLTSLSAMLGAPWWVALVSGTAISLLSIGEYQKLRARFAAVGATDMLTTSALAGFATACISAVAAFALGRLVGAILLAL